MTLSYRKVEVQMGALLRVAHKIKVLRDHGAKADNANYNSRLFDVANGYDDQVTVEKRAMGAQVKFFQEDWVNQAVALWTGYKSQVEGFNDFFGVLATGLGLSDKREADRKPIGYEYDRDLAVDGTIMLVNRTGVLGNLHKDMLTNGEYVDANTMTPGSFTAYDGNRGSLSAAAMTYLSQMPTGTLIFECVGERVESPKIAVRLELPQEDPEPDGNTRIDAQNLITADKSFSDYWLGLVNVSLTRPGLTAPTKTGDGDDFFTAAGTFVNPQEIDMAGGVLYVKVTRKADSGEEWLMEFFSDSSRTKKRGAKVLGSLTGTEAFTVILQGGTSFTQTFDKDAAAAVLTGDGDTLETITFDIETPRVGDKWYRAITNGENFNFVSKLKRLWRWTPPTAGAGTKWTNANAATVAM